jgi:microcystin-dependent protein
MFGFAFAPRGWSSCGGQLLPIAQNQALFSLLGTTFGGNGTTNFALPNLLGRAPIHQGQLPGGSNYQLGQTSGQETVTLNAGQIPMHNHQWVANNTAATATSPGGNKLAVSGTPIYESTTGNLTAMNPGAVSPAGGSQAHPNVMPCLAVSFCIALQGIYPSRN